MYWARSPLALDNRQFTHTLYGVCFYFLYTPTQINYRKSQNTLLTHLLNFYILDNSRITLFHRLSTNGFWVRHVFFAYFSIIMHSVHIRPFNKRKYVIYIVSFINYLFILNSFMNTICTVSPPKTIETHTFDTPLDTLFLHWSWHTK